jgi:hypothetical protein
MRPRELAAKFREAPYQGAVLSISVSGAEQRLVVARASVIVRLDFAKVPVMPKRRLASTSPAKRRKFVVCRATC